MLGGRGGDDLYILDLSGRDLFQGLGPGKYTGLSIYVDCESATPRKVTSPSAFTRMEGVFSRISTAVPPEESRLEEASMIFLSSL